MGNIRLWVSITMLFSVLRKIGVSLLALFRSQESTIYGFKNCTNFSVNVLFFPVGFEGGGALAVAVFFVRTVGGHRRSRPGCGAGSGAAIPLRPKSLRPHLPLCGQRIGCLVILSTVLLFSGDPDWLLGGGGGGLNRAKPGQACQLGG